MKYIFENEELDSDLLCFEPRQKAYVQLLENKIALLQVMLRQANGTKIKEGD